MGGTGTSHYGTTGKMQCRIFAFAGCELRELTGRIGTTLSPAFAGSLVAIVAHSQKTPPELRTG